MRLHRGYALCAVILFAIEVIIAVFIRDTFVRPTLGDVLAVMFVYCALLSVFAIRQRTAALIALAIAVVVEIMQYLDALTWLGLEDSQIARIVLGTTFTWGDIIAYAVGAVASLIADVAIRARQHRPAQS
ncbi:MAG: DUF2809 domain-containing protein [Pseudomonadota bacterium]